MRKFRNSFILVLLVAIGALLFFINKKETTTPEGKQIQHYREAEIVNPQRGPKFDQDWFDSEYQVIAYFTYFGEYSMINLDWNSYFDNKP